MIPDSIVFNAWRNLNSWLLMLTETKKLLMQVLVILNSMKKKRTQRENFECTINLPIQVIWSHFSSSHWIIYHDILSWISRQGGKDREREEKWHSWAMVNVERTRKIKIPRAFTWHWLWLEEKRWKRGSREKDWWDASVGVRNLALVFFPLLSMFYLDTNIEWTPLYTYVHTETL